MSVAANIWTYVSQTPLPSSAWSSGFPIARLNAAGVRLSVASRIRRLCADDHLRALTAAIAKPPNSMMLLHSIARTAAGFWEYRAQDSRTSELPRGRRARLQQPALRRRSLTYDATARFRCGSTAPDQSGAPTARRIRLRAHARRSGMAQRASEDAG